MATTTAPDPLAAWALASRDEELAAWRAMYDALHPAPAEDEQEDPR
jgi:hypothetical protein